MGAVCYMPTATIGAADLFLLGAALMGVAFALRAVRANRPGPDAPEADEAQAAA